MVEYIEREALKKKIELRIKSWSRDCNSKAPVIVNTYKEILHELQYIPTADVVEAVRCKDCVYWECRGYNGRCEAYHNGLIRDYTNYDDYCSYGEKRSEEE